MRRLTAAVVIFLLAMNVVVPPRARAVAPVVVWVGKFLGEFLLSYALGKVLDHALESVLSEGPDIAGVPVGYLNVRNDCDTLRAIARRTGQELHELQKRTKILEARERMQDSLHSHAADALRAINAQLPQATFITELPSRLDEIRRTHDRAAAERLGRELLHFRVDLTEQGGLPSFLEELVLFASSVTSAIKKLDERQLKHERELLTAMGTIQEHESQINKIGWDLRVHQRALEEHADRIQTIYQGFDEHEKRLDEIESVIKRILVFLQDQDSQHALERLRDLSVLEAKVIEIQRNYSSSENLGFLLYLQNALAVCRMPMVAAPVSPLEKVQVRGTLSYATSCRRHSFGFYACDWTFDLSKNGRRLLAHSEQSYGDTMKIVEINVQTNVARSVTEEGICELLRR